MGVYEARERLCSLIELKRDLVKFVPCYADSRAVITVILRALMKMRRS